MWWTITGLGADTRLHARLQPPQRLRHLDFTGLEHLRSIPAVAAAIVERHLRPGDSVIGSSLGGMIAMHCAAHVRLRHVVLVSSCLQAREVSRIGLALSRVSYAPVGRLLQVLAGTGQLLPHSRRTVLDMFCRADPDFMAAMGRSVASYRAPAPLGGRVHRLHGRADRVIPWQAEARYDLVLPCGHLLAMDQAAAVDAYLAGLADSADVVSVHSGGSGRSNV